jgi:uncharacterized protein
MNYLKEVITMTSYEEKVHNLEEYMTGKGDCMVAFSGGVDSSLLLKLAVKYSGGKVYAITADTELHPVCDAVSAAYIAAEIGAEHIIVRINELESADIEYNPKDRCYKCKKYIFSEVKRRAEKLGISLIMEGTNADDLKQYRPGIRAINELGIESPLKKFDFTKKEIRRLAEEYGISSADKPSAPCLATRFPYGTHLTPEKLGNVEQGETFLHKFGFYNVRLRVHEDTARIETDTESFQTVLEHKTEICAFLHKLGYRYIALDLDGFRSGSMDEKE